MATIYSAVVPIPETMQGSWGKGTTTAIVATGTGAKAARLLGVKPDQLNVLGPDNEVTDHDRDAARMFPDRVVYRDPARGKEWRLLDAPEVILP